MPQQDTSQLKEKILSIMRRRGPSLPIHVSSEIKLSMLFTSAFLSELYSEKKVRISSMKVGTSPIYYIPGQESSLENFSHHLKSKEREAFDLLKDHKILRDKELPPPIRVALRSIKDFAIPFKDVQTEELWWRYINTTEDEASQIFNKISVKPILIIKEENPKQEITIEIIKQPEISKTDEEDLNIQAQEENEAKPLDIFTPSNIESEVKTQEKIEEKEIVQEKINTHKAAPKPKRIRTKQKKKTKNVQEHDEKFFNKIKEHLNENDIEILDILGVSKNKLTLKVKQNKKESLIVAFNLRKISEKEIIESSKKAQELELNYSILSFGEPSKSISNLIEAIKSLNEIKRVN